MASSGRYTGGLGARGVRGGDAIAAQLDQLAQERNVKSFHAMISYLTRSPKGYAAMDAAGVVAGTRTQQRWLAEEQQPSKANRAAVERAYASLRRERLARGLRERLTRSGGVQMEIQPVDQSKVPADHHRPLDSQLGQRKLTPTPTEWDRIVDAWADDDVSELTDIYEGLAEESLGSDYAAYGWVSSVGFG